MRYTVIHQICQFLQLFYLKPIKISTSIISMLKINLKQLQLLKKLNNSSRANKTLIDSEIIKNFENFAKYKKVENLNYYKNVGNLFKFKI